jgi:hypothetical protein
MDKHVQFNFGGPDPKAPPPPPPPPGRSDAAANVANSTKPGQKAKGRQSTIMAGLLAPDAVATGKKTLLGG